MSSTLKQPEPGMIIYTPNPMYRGSVTYIRFQKTEQHKYQGSNYVVELSAVGEYILKNQIQTRITHDDFIFHNEISVRKTNHKAARTFRRTCMT